MKDLLVGNAPCSWGTLEFEDAKGEQIPFDRMLDELVETGYTGTELGDWGYMPTDPATLRNELDQAQPGHAGRVCASRDEVSRGTCGGVATAVKTARLLAAVASTPAPFLVLADDNGTDPDANEDCGPRYSERRTEPGEWKTFAAGANQIARAVFDETGLRTVFHHHCAGYVETPEEIATLLELTDPAAARPGLRHRPLLPRHRRRELRPGRGSRSLRRPHLVHPPARTVEPDVARRARTEQWDYFTACATVSSANWAKVASIFRPCCAGCSAQDYEGYRLVEQDILPGMGTPKESARRNREYLRSIAHNFTESLARV